MKLKTLVAGLVGAMMFGPAAMAADIQVIVPAAPPVVVVPPAPAFDWTGLYFGAYTHGPLDGVEFGGQAGLNVVRGNLLFGGEGRIGVLGGNLTLGAAGRVGMLVGAQDRLLFYTTVAAEFIPGGAFIVMGTGGAEFGIGSRLSVFGEAGIFGLPGDGCCLPIFRGGVNFHL